MEEEITFWDVLRTLWGWILTKADRARRKLRRRGLAPFGFAQEDFRHGHQLLHVWGPLLPARFEVYRWPPNTGTYEKDKWLRPLPFGSPEMRHRIQLSTDLVYAGKDWKAARAAMRGECPASAPADAGKDGAP